MYQGAPKCCINLYQSVRSFDVAEDRGAKYSDVQFLLFYLELLCYESANVKDKKLLLSAGCGGASSTAGVTMHKCCIKLRQSVAPSCAKVLHQVAPKCYSKLHKSSSLCWMLAAAAPGMKMHYSNYVPCSCKELKIYP